MQVKVPRPRYDPQQQREYRLKNKEARAIKAKEYRIKNKEKFDRRKLENKEKDAEYQRAYRLKHKEKFKAYMRGYQRPNKEARENYRLKALYGINLEIFRKMLAEQDFKCKICLKDTPGGSGKFHVDHCRTTNVVRGLLCFLCNTMIGSAKDKPETLRRAAEYLEATEKEKNNAG